MKKSHLKSTILGLIAAVAMFSNLSVINAAGIYGETCKVGIFPYNPAAASDLLGNAASPYVNVVNDINCDSHLKYSKFSSTADQYLPQPPPNTNDPNSGTPLVSANAEDKRVPWAHHDHAYFNDKNSNGDNFYYKSFVDRFEITIQNDGYKNLDLSGNLNNIKCWTEVPGDFQGDASDLEDCNGYSTVFGGTTVTKQIKKIQDPNIMGVVITWQFASDNGHKGRPQILGNNGNSFDLYKKDSNGNTVVSGLNLNLTSPYQRDLPFGVEILTKNNNEEVWSATTTSRTLIADLAMEKGDYNADHKNTALGCGNNLNDPATKGWCYTGWSGNYPIEFVNTPSGNMKYYWFPIGSVATIWKKPPVAVEACTKLDILQNGQVISGQSLAFNNNINNLTVDATTTPGLGPLKFKWDGKSGQPSQIMGTFTSPTNPLQVGPANPLTTHAENTAVNYSGANPNGTTTVTVNAYKESDANSLNVECSKSFTIQPQSQNPGCQNLNLNYLSDTFPANATIPLHANPKNTTSPDPASVQWSETGAGVLTRGAFSQTITGLMICPTPVDNTPFTALATCDYNYNTPATGSGSVTINAVPNVGNNAACTKTITFQNGGPVCTDVVLTPSQLDADNVTNLNATAIFSDGQQHQATVQWIGNNGTFTGNVLNQNNQQASANNNFQVAFSSNSSSSEASVQLINAVGADLGVCNGLIKKTTPSAACIGPVVFHPQPSGDICVSFQGSYNGPFQWTYGSPAQTKTTQGPCLGVNLPPNSPVSVFATQSCQGSFTFPSPNPPTLEKGVKRAAQATTYKHLINVPQTTNDLSEVEYQLKFTPDPSTPNLTTTIIDDINKGYIQGITGLGIGGRIDYVEGSMQVKTASGSNIPKCPQPGTCYSGDMGKPGGVTLQKINGQVIITYRGRIINSAINEDNCQNTLVCQEKYPNTATAKNMSYQPQSNSPAIALPYTITDNALVQIFCRYILARAAGDIYLETDLKTGIDISKCSEYKNTTGLTITPETPKAPELGKTGKDELVMINHDICTKGQNGDLSGTGLENYYGTGVSANLSSSICEVRLRPGVAWKQKTIVDDVTENKVRISRWDPTLPEGASGEINDLVQSYPDQKVYHIKGGDLRVDYSDFTLSDGQGAKTFIVENGDLIINNNINYGGCNKVAPEVCNVRDIASLAFIVLNGNIYVDPTVTTLSGVFFVQKGVNAQNGLLVSGSEQSPNQYSEDPLTVYGSIYGDIQPLFEQRYYSGDAAQEDSGILIRFDERVILNTPAGLQDILRESSSEIAG